MLLYWKFLRIILHKLHSTFWKYFLFSFFKKLIILSIIILKFLKTLAWSWLYRRRSQTMALINFNSWQHRFIFNWLIKVIAKWMNITDWIASGRSMLHLAWLLYLQASDNLFCLGIIVHFLKGTHSYLLLYTYIN